MKILVKVFFRFKIIGKGFSELRISPEKV